MRRGVQKKVGAFKDQEVQYDTVVTEAFRVERSCLPKCFKTFLVIYPVPYKKNTVMFAFLNVIIFE